MSFLGLCPLLVRIIQDGVHKEPNVENKADSFLITTFSIFYHSNLDLLSFKSVPHITQGIIRGRSKGIEMEKPRSSLH